MKQFLSMLLVFSCVMPGLAQPAPRSSSTYHLNGDSASTMDIREKLVQLALQNPSYEITDHAVNIADYNIRIAKAAWLSMAFASFNINEYSINPSSAGTQAIYYPKYNFGINIPFNVFALNTNNLKIARENYMVALANKNDRYRQVRQDVLTKYEDYLLSKQLMDFQVQVSQDEYTLYKRAEKDYTDGITKLEDYDRAYRSWIEQQVKKITLQRNLNVFKLELERMIGVKLEDALQNKQ